MIVILGLGFTGKHLAWRLLLRRVPVHALVRGVERFRSLSDAGLVLSEMTSGDALASVPKNSTAVHLIPPLPEPDNSTLRRIIGAIRPRRVVYVSSTSVYGDQIDVNEQSLPAPSDQRGRARLGEEQWIRSGPWSSLILRSAAIYGPGRGVHAALRAGKTPRGTAAGIVSRIHLDDLVTTIEAGVFSGLSGAWPVADEMPCPTEEIAAWCVEHVGGCAPQAAAPQTLIPVSGRRVNGAGIRDLLGIKLAWPSWKTGLPASLAQEVNQ